MGWQTLRTNNDQTVQRAAVSSVFTLFHLHISKTLFHGTNSCCTRYVMLTVVLTFQVLCCIYCVLYDHAFFCSLSCIPVSPTSPGKSVKSTAVTTLSRCDAKLARYSLVSWPCHHCTSYHPNIHINIVIVWRYQTQKNR